MIYYTNDPSVVEITQKFDLEAFSSIELKIAINCINSTWKATTKTDALMDKL